MELALSAEELFPKKIRRWFIIGKREIKPNRPLSVFEYFRYFIWGGARHDSAENIDNALHPRLVRAHLLSVWCPDCLLPGSSLVHTIYQSCAACKLVPAA